jgi:hypothetical protein
VQSVTLGGDDPRTSIRELHGLYVDDAGNTVLAGHFLGCIKFDATAKRTCVDPAVAHRNGESCDGHLYYPGVTNENAGSGSAKPPLETDEGVARGNRQADDREDDREDDGEQGEGVRTS